MESVPPSSIGSWDGQWKGWAESEECSQGDGSTRRPQSRWGKLGPQSFLRSAHFDDFNRFVIFMWNLLNLMQQTACYLHRKCSNTFHLRFSYVMFAGKGFHSPFQQRREKRRYTCCFWGFDGQRNHARVRRAFELRNNTGLSKNEAVSFKAALLSVIWVVMIYDMCFLYVFFIWYKFINIKFAGWAPRSVFLLKDLLG